MRSAAPVVTAPVVTAPVVTAPVVTAPVVTAPLARGPRRLRPVQNISVVAAFGGVVMLSAWPGDRHLPTFVVN